VADIHVGTPRSYRYAPAWNENWTTARGQIVDSEPDLLLVGGDLTRDGATHRYELDQIKADLDRLPFPYYVVPGNHEVGNKQIPNTIDSQRLFKSVSVNEEYLSHYASVFGGSEWSFLHKDVRFTGFNTFLLGSELPQERLLWDWLELQAKEPKTGFHVWVMHQSLFMDRPDEPNIDVHADRAGWYFNIDNPHRSRLLEIFKATKADLVISGHIHCRREVGYQGIRLYFAPATAFPQVADRWYDGDPTLGFTLCEVSSDAITPNFIPLNRLSTIQGYGPGGNPDHALRDYSIATKRPTLEEMGQAPH
jgi:3',5'-cyclic AMP phosphodiesterase CpdA